MFTPGRVLFLPQDQNLNTFGKGQRGVAMYKISRLKP